VIVSIRRFDANCERVTDVHGHTHADLIDE